MKKLILITALASFSFTAPALACDFHGAGFGSPFGTWDPYKVDQASSYDDSEKTFSFTPIASKRDTVKKKPVFSKIASRASDIAKMRIEKKKTDAEKLAKSETSLEKTETP